MNLAESNLVGALLDALPLAVWIADSQYTIYIFNPAAESILGWTAGDARGLSLPELLASPHEAKRVMESLRTHPDQSVGPLELALRRRDGEDVSGRLLLSGLTDSLGEPIGVLGIFEDRRKELAQGRQLAEAVDQLWEAEQRVAGLTRMNNALHALSQPLTAAMGLTELLQDDRLPPETLVHFEKLTAQLERLRQGLGDLARLLHAPPPPSHHRRYP